MLEDSICAPATPPVNSPIAIIRISGPDTNRAVRLIFDRGGDLPPRQAVYGSIVKDGEIIDDVVMVFYASPRSFTGEDMAEIFCHGNPIIVNKILSLLHRCGIRMAEPGEFSKRAFLNGKIDLTEAEAINHIITARNEWEIEASIRQMHGSMKHRINEIRDRLIRLKADIECGIDFIGEDIELISAGDARSQAEDIGRMIEDLAERCRIGEKISHGIDVPIVGKPNVGKSSILNLILNSERAIVSDTPGTTRDLIREPVRIGGIHLNLFDTAGIDTPMSDIEKKGIELSHKKIESSPLVLMVLDAATGVQEADRGIIEKIMDKKKIFVLNKIDLVSGAEAERLLASMGKPVIPFSALNGTGLKDLEQEIAGMLRREYVEYKDFYLADLRMMFLLEESLSSVENVKALLSAGEPAEIVAFEMQTLLDTLTGITGEITPDDVLNSVFSRFCIGK